VSVYVFEEVRPVNVIVPPRSLAPDQLPKALQDVVLEVFQVRNTDWPYAIAVLDAANVRDGAGVGEAVVVDEVPFTAIETVFDIFIPCPLQVNVMVCGLVTLLRNVVPIIEAGRLNFRSPLKLHSATILVIHWILTVPPGFTVIGSAVSVKARGGIAVATDAD